MSERKLVWLVVAVVLLTVGCGKKPRRNITTELHSPAATGDLAKVQKLIADGANVNAKDNWGRTPLHAAAYKGHQEVVEVLVRCGAQIDSEDKAGCTPALLAMHLGHRAVVERLVQMGATVNLGLAVYLGDTERARSLIQSGAARPVETESTQDPARRVISATLGGRDTWTPLHYAAAYNRREIGDLLIASGAAVDARDGSDLTPLHLAALSDSVEVMELLVARKAPLNAQDKDGDTALHLAARENHVDTAKLLVSAGADMEVTNKQRETPLYLAAEWGRTEAAALLIAGGAGADGKRVGKAYPRHPLSAAISNGHIDVVRLLAPKVKDINSDLPLYWAMTSSFLSAGIRFDRERPDPKAPPEDRQAARQREMDNLRIRMVELLLAHGADVNRTNADGQTALHYAAYQGLKDIAELLLKKGADVNAKATQRYGLRDVREEVFTGITPLHDAALRGGPGVVELLIAHGAKVGARTESGKTPLHYAASYRYARGREVSVRQQRGERGNWPQGDVVRLLLAKGADVNARDKDGVTPLRYALQSGQRDLAEILTAAGAEKVTVKNEGDQTMLHDAFRQKDFGLIRLLLANSADPEEVDAEGNTLLHLAARDQNQELAELLLAHQAKVNARNRGGITPLCYAAAGGASDLVSLLLTNGADVNSKDNGGDTALHGAALRGQKEVVPLLLARGADINARNSRGRTPLDEAIRRGHADIVQLLMPKAKRSDAGGQDDRIKK